MLLHCHYLAVVLQGAQMTLRRRSLMDVEVFGWRQRKNNLSSFIPRCNGSFHSSLIPWQPPTLTLPTPVTLYSIFHYKPPSAHPSRTRRSKALLFI